jgi:hypothetical protein
MDKLIRIVLGILVIAVFSYSGFGQHRVLVPVQRYSQAERSAQRLNPAQRFVQENNTSPKGGRKIQAVKEGFITKRLDLTSSEAITFWPLYRKYNEELTAVKILKKINNSNATVDGAKQVDQDLQYETELVNIKKRYRDEFFKILPPEKVSILYKSEHEFNNELFKQLTERSIRAGD